MTTTLKDGWLGRQVEATIQEIKTWPSWMQRESGYSPHLAVHSQSGHHAAIGERRNMTHAELVCRAERWLRRSATMPSRFGDRLDKTQCRVVLTELVCSAGEIPDAIGWSYGGMFSFLVECKVSRADFRADKSKTHRRHGMFGVGMFRYYMAPVGVITDESLPENWGLVETDGRREKVVRVAAKQEYSWQNEMRMLWSAVRRIQDERLATPPASGTIAPVEAQKP